MTLVPSVDQDLLAWAASFVTGQASGPLAASSQRSASQAAYPLGQHSQTTRAKLQSPRSLWEMPHATKAWAEIWEILPEGWPHVLEVVCCNQAPASVRCWRSTFESGVCSVASSILAAAELCSEACGSDQN